MKKLAKIVFNDKYALLWVGLTIVAAGIIWAFWGKLGVGLFWIVWGGCVFYLLSIDKK